MRISGKEKKNSNGLIISLWKWISEQKSSTESTETLANPRKAAQVTNADWSLPNVDKKWHKELHV